ncbi:TPA: hypothetical protein G8O12_005429 [Salmonella enterica]|uniref:Uncharacterized protein n=1 Tax=Salmonella enterica TaxID=28901 RepID=A0A742RDH9_SALER|nr:hypothetical protein [Salmonella enterica]HAF4642648.1 hypothetical protein [Salmonella enterica]HAF4748255.1 hypothetical protein [Salmonella enterica]HCM6306591.1 hypothetical protein [Salmonella enterica subsp. enterica serovar 6,14:y:1,7]
MSLNTYFFVINNQMTSNHGVPDSNVHRPDIFKTMIHFPNHERAIKNVVMGRKSWLFAGWCVFWPGVTGHSGGT